MLHDTWYAIRRLRARPWHTAVVVAIFAIGSGSALTVFRIADVVLLQSLPYQGAERIAHIAMSVPVAKDQQLPFSDVGYRALEHRTRSFDAFAAYRTVGTNLTIGTTPERALSARVTGSFFEMLGLKAQQGRLFLPGEETQHGPTVIVLSDAVWRQRFGAKSSVVGTTVRIDGVPATIVGVADRRVGLPVASVAYWTLMDLDPTGKNPFELGLEVIARIKPGTSFEAASSDASRVIREVARENPGPHSTPTSDYSAFHAVLAPLRDNMVGGMKPTLALLSAAVVFVLCLTCVNVAALELVRSSGRRSELAVRAALGASRRRLISGALIEGGIQSLLGGVLGLVLSVLAESTLRSLVPDAFGGAAGSRFSVGIVVAAVLAILLCTGASAAFPIAAAMNKDVQSALRERSGSATSRLTLIRRGLVIAQIMFACVLVNGAALMIVTVHLAQQVSLGFQPDGLLMFQLSLPSEGYRTAAEVATTFRTLANNLRQVAGVTQVGLASNVPLGGQYDDGPIAVEGRAFKADGTDPNVDFRVVSAGYLEALPVKVLAGRSFSEGDSYLDGTPVVISESAARMLWPEGGDPIGHRIRTGPYSPWLPIIGVVSDVRNRSLTLPSRPEVYLPFGAPRSPVGTSRDMAVVIRASGPLPSVQAAAKTVALQTNPDLPLYGARRFDEVIRLSQLREVTTMRTLAGFAAVALALAVAGSYAILMFGVVQRKRELALRQAVGATAGDIALLVGREMVMLLVLGTGAGVAGTLLLSRLMSRFLFGISAIDPRVTLATMALVALAGVAAAIPPARRAAAIDPMNVLRSE